MAKYILIHGSYAKKEDNWYGPVARKLAKHGEEVFSKDYPTDYDLVNASVVQRYEGWAKVLDEYKEKIDEDTIFIGHSISCIFIVKYCLENNLHPKGCVFVSGFNNYSENHTEFISGLGADKVFNDAMDSFYVSDNELKKFRDLCDNVVCIYSNDDPIISQERLKQFAKDVATDVVKVKEAGHFCEGVYKTSFDELDEIIENINNKNAKIMSK